MGRSPYAWLGWHINRENLGSNHLELSFLDEGTSIVRRRSQTYLSLNISENVLQAKTEALCSFYIPDVYVKYIQFSEYNKRRNCEICLQYMGWIVSGQLTSFSK